MVIAARADRPVSFQTWNAIATTPLDFRLDAGAYGFTYFATAWGTAVLSRVLSDGAGGQIVVPIFAAALAANGYQKVGLPAGWYRLTLAGVTAFTGAIEQIAPGRQGGS
jgi:hypothetical protein